MRIATDVCCILAQRSRARRPRGPSHSVPDKRARADQPDSLRGPHFDSRLLGRARQRQRRSCVDPRMSGLERDLHVALLFVDRIPDKTRVYLERSKSSLIDLRIDREYDLSPHDPLFQIIPLATGRLRSLRVEGSPDSLPDITQISPHA